MSAPASAAATTCATVALTSAVSVLVIVCTVIGASPPTGTRPTMIWRDWRRSMLRQGRIGLWVIAAGPSRGNPVRYSTDGAECQAVW